MSPANPALPGSGRKFLVAAILLNTLVYFSLISDSRVPRGGPALEFLQLQESALIAGQPAPSPPGLLLLRALWPLLTVKSLLPAFHLAMLLNELLFLTGVWLLSRRYFEAPRTSFVVTVAAAGSCLWTGRIHEDFLVACTVPLTLHFLHRFLDANRLGHLALAVLLATLQPARPALLCCALYLAGYALFRWTEAAARFAILRKDRGHAIAMLAALAAVVGVGFRTPETPATPGPPWIGLDLFLGAALSSGPTAFCGFFTVSLAGIAIAGHDHRRMSGLLAFAGGSFLILALAGSGLPFAKIFIAFLSGAGLERIRREPKAAALTAGGLILLAGALCVAALQAIPYRREMEHALEPLLGRPEGFLEAPDFLGARMLSEFLGAAALGCGAAGAALLLYSSSSRARPIAFALILLLHPLDVYGWKARMVWLRTRPVSSEPGEASAPRTGRDAGTSAAVAGGIVLIVVATAHELGLRRRRDSS